MYGERLSSKFNETFFTNYKLLSMLSLLDCFHLKNNYLNRLFIFSGIEDSGKDLLSADLFKIIPVILCNKFIKQNIISKNQFSF